MATFGIVWSERCHGLHFDTIITLEDTRWKLRVLTYVYFLFIHKSSCKIVIYCPIFNSSKGSHDRGLLDRLLRY